MRLALIASSQELSPPPLQLSLKNSVWRPIEATPSLHLNPQTLAFLPVPEVTGMASSSWGTMPALCPVLMSQGYLHCSD